MVVVKGTSSTPNPGEQRYAEVIAEKLSRLLDGAGIHNALISDEDVGAGRLPAGGIAILAYNPFPGQKEISALSRHVREGGRLIVFYSAAPGLAELMGVRLGPYRSDPLGHRWCGMRFNAHAPGHVPPNVLQRSRNIRPVYPAGGGGKVIAYWETASGEITEDPAWVRTRAGFWMSHVLLDDGDTQEKSRMMTALVGALEPGLWKSAAVHRRQEAIHESGFFAGLRRRVLADKDRHVKIVPLLESAEALKVSAARHFEAGRWPQAIEDWDLYNFRMTTAYAALQPRAPDAFRGIWEHSGLGLYPGDWERTCSLVADAGLSDLLVNVAWPGKAHYASELVPASREFTLLGDQLSQALSAAHAKGLKVHAWKVCWRMDGAPPALMEKLRREKRLQKSVDGKEIPWLCPSDPRNLVYEKDTIREIVKKYPVDGIHLDYIRYRDSAACFCAGCRSRFEAASGRRVKNWPESARSGTGRQAYSQWRVHNISRFVRDVHALTRRVNPDIRLSAAVFGKHPQCVASVAQDWAAWLKDGTVDFVCPMNYTDELARFEGYTKPQLHYQTRSARVYPGIGVTADESRLGPIDTMHQINKAASMGAGGFTIFELNAVTEREILPFLKLGVTRRQRP